MRCTHIRKIALLIALTLCFLTTQTNISAKPPSLVVHMIDVSGPKLDADAFLIETPNGKSILLDSGYYQNRGGKVKEYLRKKGVGELDMIIASHAHSDHIGGHAELLNLLNANGRIIDSGYSNDTNTYKNYMRSVCQLVTQGIASFSGLAK